MPNAYVAQFSEEQKKWLFTQPLPKHIALIPDGNRRWAKQRSLPSLEGHQAGIIALNGFIESCLELKIPYLTVYGFSTENRKRPPEETLPMLMLIAGSCLLGAAFGNWMVGAGFACLAMYLRPDA